MKNTSYILAAAAVLTAVVGARTASANLLTNGGLELSAPAVSAPNGFLIINAPAGDSSTLPGWTITNSIDVVPSSYWQAAQGLDSVDLMGSPGMGAIAQTVTTLVPGDTYALSFDFAVNPSSYHGENVTTKQLQLTITDPSSIIAATQLYQGTVGSATNADMNYISESLAFIATNSSETFSFAALTSLNIPAGLQPSDLACGPVIDNVDLEISSGTKPPVPEPASLGLLASGSLVLLRRKSKRSY